MLRWWCLNETYSMSPCASPEKAIWSATRCQSTAAQMCLLSASYPYPIIKSQDQFSVDMVRPYIPMTMPFEPFTLSPTFTTTRRDYPVLLRSRFLHLACFESSAHNKPTYLFCVGFLRLESSTTYVIQDMWNHPYLVWYRLSGTLKHFLVNSFYVQPLLFEIICNEK